MPVFVFGHIKAVVDIGDAKVMKQHISISVRSFSGLNYSFITNETTIKTINIGHHRLTRA